MKENSTPPDPQGTSRKYKKYKKCIWIHIFKPDMDQDPGPEIVPDPVNIVPKHQKKNKSTRNLLSDLRLLNVDILGEEPPLLLCLLY